jgi:hypothetical protein
MRHQMASTGRRPLGYLSIAKSLVADSDNGCRWQALTVIADFVDNRPDAVWTVVKRYGNSDDADLRMGIAVCLLEELLDRKRGTYEQLVFREIAAGRQWFASALRSCWDLGPSSAAKRRRDKRIAAAVARAAARSARVH